MLRYDEQYTPDIIRGIFCRIIILIFSLQPNILRVKYRQKSIQILNTARKFVNNLQSHFYCSQEGDNTTSRHNNPAQKSVAFIPKSYPRPPSLLRPGLFWRMASG
jgi:hypothetical protein